MIIPNIWENKNVPNHQPDYIPRNYDLRLRFFRLLWSSWNSSWISLEGQNLIATETRLLKWPNDVERLHGGIRFINMNKHCSYLIRQNIYHYCESSSILLDIRKTEHLASINNSTLLWRSLHTGWWFRRELLHLDRLPRQHPELALNTLSSPQAVKCFENKINATYAEFKDIIICMLDFGTSLIHWHTDIPCTPIQNDGSIAISI